MMTTDALLLLDTEHRLFTERFDAFAPEARLWRPGPEQWNANDVMEHLVRVEEGLIVGLERQLAAGEGRRDVGVPSPEALGAVRTFLRSGGRTRVPARAAAYIAPQGDDPGEVRERWDRLPGRWREALGSVPEALADVGLLLHPRAGAITARGAALFAADHRAHHAAQLKRLQEAEGFPGG